MKFSCEMGFPILNNPGNLNLSCTMHLDFSDCFGRENPVIYPKEYGNNLLEILSINHIQYV